MATFIKVDGQFINLNHVVKIAPLQGGKCGFEFADGTTQSTLTAFDPEDDLPRNEPIIPAPVGWRVIVGGCADEFLLEGPAYEEAMGSDHPDAGTRAEEEPDSEAEAPQAEGRRDDRQGRSGAQERAMNRERISFAPLVDIQRTAYGAITRRRIPMPP